jgi:hypothetical protein
VVNATNMFGKDNPRWPIGNVPESIRVPGPGVPAPRGPVPAQHAAATPAIGMSDRPADTGDVIRRAAAVVAAWMTGLPRRAGRRLFAMNDLEARWRGWQIIEVAGGLGRQYRDPRFDSLGTPGGTVRTADSAPLVPPRPAVPEAWDDHWDGRSLSSGEDDGPGCHPNGEA